MLLTWSNQAISEWTNSGNALKLLERLIEDLRKSQGAEQLALTLAALLCHKQLLPSTPTDGFSLVNLDAVFHGSSSRNHRAVFERMGLSLLRVLDSLGEHPVAIRLLAGSFRPDLLISIDGFLDQYVAERILHEFSHESAMMQLRMMALSL